MLKKLLFIAIALTSINCFSMEPDFITYPKEDYERLLESIKKGDLEEVKKSLKPGMNLNLEIEGHRTATPLKYAAHFPKDPLILEYLLKNGADINFVDPSTGNSALHAAIVSGRLPNIVYLIAKGADVNKAAINGTTPIMLLITFSKGYKDNNDLEALKILRNADANINYVVPINGFSPLLYAAQLGRDKIVSYLLDNGAYIDQKDKDGDSAVDLALAGAFDAVEGPMSYYTGRKVYQYSIAENNYPNVLKALLDRDIDVNIQPDSNGRTLLMKAVQIPGAHIVINKLLTMHPELLNMKDKNGDTALILATKSNNAEAVDVLIKAGADGMIKNNDGKTAVDIANDGNLDTLHKLWNTYYVPYYQTGALR